MFIPTLLFILGLVLLVKGGDWFVEGAAAIAERFKMPQLLIGATVVSIGTTLPEVMVSASSAISGHGEIAYGNAIGSIICNTALIAAITITFAPGKVERKTLITPVFFFFMSAAFYSTIAYTKGFFSRTTGVMLLIIFLIYMILTVRQAFKDEGSINSDSSAMDNDKVVDANVTEEITGDNEGKKGFFNKYEDMLWFQVVLLVVGAILIAIGANLLVENGTLIAQAMGVPESVVAVTFVALGTSLPELVTAITSLIKKCGALSLGNVIGANLFNLVLVSGVSCTVSPFAVPRTNMIGSLPSSLAIEIPVMLFVMAFLTIPSLIKGKLMRYQGIVLLIIYAGFIAFQFM